jgi:FkbM family methyltransferase
MVYHGQYKQDQHLNDSFFKNKKSTDEKPLYFLEAGADDGISLSNTYFYEKELGWKGLLFEPNPDMFAEAIKIRSNPVLNIALSNKTGTAEFRKNVGYTRSLSGLTEAHDPKYMGEKGRIQSEIRAHGGSSEIIQVPTRLLNDVLEEHKIFEIEFMSLDTEGSEMLILENFDFDKYLIKVFTIENNYHEGAPRDFMKSKGYRLHSQKTIDDIWLKIGCEYDK